MVGNRCLHELQVAETGNESEDGSRSINMSELGQSVLTLAEVMMVFDKESAMYNIKVTGQETRTVVLTKNEVEVDGSTKVIVMIRDISDRMKLK